MSFFKRVVPPAHYGYPTPPLPFSRPRCQSTPATDMEKRLNMIQAAIANLQREMLEVREAVQQIRRQHVAQNDIVHDRQERLQLKLDAIRDFLNDQ